MRIIIKFHFLATKYSIWSYQLNSYTVQLVHELHGEWVQTFGAAMSGIVWVDKRYLWLIYVALSTISIKVTFRE